MARVLIAVMPVASALGMRLLLGQNRFTRFLISLATCWFLLSVLSAPYSRRVRQDIYNLPMWFR